MKVTFVYPGAESLAVEYLSSMLKVNGHKSCLVFDPVLFNDQQYLNVPLLAKLFDSKKKLMEDILETKPNLIAFSVVTDHYLWACSIARRIKKLAPEIPILFGGIHVTSVPDEVIKNDFVDIICVGEGEEAIVELANNLKNGKDITKIKNLWVREGGIVHKNPVRSLINLNKLPLPDKELFEDYVPIKNGMYMIMASRGCPFNCNYCCNSVLRQLNAKGMYLRWRSPSNVIRELKIMDGKYSFSGVQFMDDLFTTDRKWVIEFLSRYKEEINKPFECMTHTAFLDRSLALILKEAGCTRIKFGIQTINEGIRKRVLNRDEKHKHVVKALRACDGIGLGYSLDHIVGIPYETREGFLETAEFFSQTNALRVNCYALCYFPKTRIVDIAKKYGVLNDKQIKLIEEGKGTMYIYGSSLKGKDLEFYYALRKFYSLMPFISKKKRLKLLESGNFRYFNYIPRFITLIGEYFIAKKSSHFRGTNYLDYYLMHLRRRLNI